MRPAVRTYYFWLCARDLPDDKVELSREDVDELLKLRGRQQVAFGQRRRHYHFHDTAVLGFDQREILFQLPAVQQLLEGCDARTRNAGDHLERNFLLAALAVCSVDPFH